MAMLKLSGNEAYAFEAVMEFIKKLSPASMQGLDRDAFKNSIDRIFDEHSIRNEQLRVKILMAAMIGNGIDTSEREENKEENFIKKDVNDSFPNQAEQGNVKKLVKELLRSRDKTFKAKQIADLTKRQVICALVGLSRQLEKANEVINQLISVKKEKELLKKKLASYRGDYADQQNQDR